jgi:hypothetical protein
MLSFWAHVPPDGDTTYPDDPGGEGGGDGRPPGPERDAGERITTACCCS